MTDRAAPAAEALKSNAIGFVDSLVIGLASTAPAYTLAAIVGSLVVVVGIQAPGALLLSFVPMFLIAGAFFYLNRADSDAGALAGAPAQQPRMPRAVSSRQNRSARLAPWSAFTPLRPAS